MKNYLFITILFFTLVNTSFATTGNKRIIVIDAGSSHSTLYLYEYKPDNPLPSSIKTIYQKTVNPGISAISTDPATLDSYFSGLFGEANATYPNHIPTYFYATAGMRLLSPEKQQQYYNELNTWVKNHSQFRLIDHRTLDGQWEGIYGWVALNYLLHNFTHDQSTAGILDMGGSSTQITYQMPDNLAADSVDLAIGERHYTLHAKSYLGLGQDLARSQFVDDVNCSPIDYPLPNGEKGQGNFSQCQLEVNSLINDIHHVHQQAAAIPAQMPFYLVSGYYYEAAAKPIDLLTDFNSQALINKGTAFCSQPWDVSKQEYPKEKYLYSNCFNAAYQASLLHDGYGFDVSKQLLPTNQIDNNDLGWAMGVALMNAAQK